MRGMGCEDVMWWLAGVRVMAGIFCGGAGSRNVHRAVC